MLASARANPCCRKKLRKKAYCRPMSIPEEFAEYHERIGKKRVADAHEEATGGKHSVIAPGVRRNHDSTSFHHTYVPWEKS
jgi:hypothetical protein